MTAAQAVKLLLLEEAAYYDQPMNELRLKALAGELEGEDPVALRQAARFFRQDPKRQRMPLPAELKARLRPTADPAALALEAASRLTAAVPRFGSYQGEAARAWMGELAWLGVQRFGGWQVLCEKLGTRDLPVTVFQAQARDLFAAQARLAEAGHQGGPALPAAQVLNQLAARSTALPEPKEDEP